MKVYSLTQVSNMAEIGCCGVFSSPEKATDCAIEFAKNNGEPFSEETIWNGFNKTVYCGEYEFEIWAHNIDEL
jgi:hypothetical protein